MTGPYCTWRTCRALAVVIHRGQSGNQLLEAGACVMHDRQVHDRCAKAGPVTSRNVPAADNAAPEQQDALF